MLKRDELKNIELNQKKIEIYKGLNKLSISNLYKKYESQTSSGRIKLIDSFFQRTTKKDNNSKSMGEQQNMKIIKEMQSNDETNFLSQIDNLLYENSYEKYTQKQENYFQQTNIKYFTFSKAILKSKLQKSLAKLNLEQSILNSSKIHKSNLKSVEGKRKKLKYYLLSSLQQSQTNSSFVPNKFLNVIKKINLPILKKNGKDSHSCLLKFKPSNFSHRFTHKNIINCRKKQ